LKVVDVADRGRLTKTGHSVFAADPRAVRRGSDEAGVIRQFAYEDSAADEIKMLMQMTSAGREVDANVSMIQQHDRMMEKAINSLGRIA
jgi:flagellar basal-body rod protein FlgF